MTPEAARYLEKVEKCVSDAKISLEVGLNNDAGRGAYLKAVADYETGPDSELSLERAATAVEDADAFLFTVAAGLRHAPPDPPAPSA